MWLRLALIVVGLGLLWLLPLMAEGRAEASRRAVLHCVAAEELLQAGHWGPAESAFRRAAEMEPLLGAAHCGIAKIRFNQGRYGESVEAYEAALATLAEVNRVLGTTPAPPPMIVEGLAAARQALARG